MISPNDLETLRQGAQLYIMRGLTNYTISPGLLLELINAYEEERDFETAMDDARLDGREECTAEILDLEDELDKAHEEIASLKDTLHALAVATGAKT